LAVFLGKTAARISGWHRQIALAVFKVEDKLRADGATSMDLDYLVNRLMMTQRSESIMRP
jgi:hypothetical protein